MSNPFDLITTELKTVFKQAILGVLTGCSLPCTIIYAGTKWTTCPNCLPDNIHGKSSNQYNGTGPQPFNHGICPVCNGAYKIQVENTETVNLAPIWSPKQWTIYQSIKDLKIDVQTMSEISTLAALKRASKVKINTNITNYGIPSFVRTGEPQPMGLGEDAFIICSWSRE